MRVTGQDEAFSLARSTFTRLLLPPMGLAILVLHFCYLDEPTGIFLTWDRCWIRPDDSNLQDRTSLFPQATRCTGSFWETPI